MSDQKNKEQVELEVVREFENYLHDLGAKDVKNMCNTLGFMGSMINRVMQRLGILIDKLRKQNEELQCCANCKHLRFDSNTIAYNDHYHCVLHNESYDPDAPLLGDTAFHCDDWEQRK